MDGWLLDIGKVLLLGVLFGALIYSGWRSVRCPRCRKLGMLREKVGPPDFPLRRAWRPVYRCRNCGYVEQSQEHYSRGNINASKISLAAGILAGLVLGGFIGSRIVIVVAPTALSGFAMFGGWFVTAAAGGLAGYAIWRIGGDLLARRR